MYKMHEWELVHTSMSYETGETQPDWFCKNDVMHNMCSEQITVHINRLERFAQAARQYIDVCLGDPDTNDKTWAAWQKYQKILKELND